MWAHPFLWKTIHRKIVHDFNLKYNSKLLYELHSYVSVVSCGHAIQLLQCALACYGGGGGGRGQGGTSVLVGMTCNNTTQNN